MTYQRVEKRWTTRPRAEPAVHHPKGGGDKGATIQGKQVTFTVVGEKVKIPQFTVALGPCTSTITIFGSDKISDSGRFAIAGSAVSFTAKHR